MLNVILWVKSISVIQYLNDLKQDNYDTSNTFPNNKAITAVSPEQVSYWRDIVLKYYPLLMKFKHFAHQDGSNKFFRANTYQLSNLLVLFGNFHY